MAEIPALFSQRDIVIKHYKAAMYHPFVEAAALTIVDLPIVRRIPIKVVHTFSYDLSVRPFSPPQPTL